MCSLTTVQWVTTAGFTLHAISKENLVGYPVGGRLLIPQSTNIFELRFRASLSNGHAPRLEVTKS